MKPSSSTEVGSRSVRVHTLDGSKDVRGASHEPKGRVDLRLPWLVDLGLC